MAERAAIDRLVGLLSSSRFLLQQLGRRMFGGRHAARRAAERLAGEFWPASRPIPRTAVAVTEQGASGVALVGYFHAETGIAQSVRRSALSFRACHYPVSCHAISDPSRYDESVPFDVAAEPNAPFETALVHLNADSLLALSPGFPPDLLKRRKVVGYWHWELPVFPALCAAAFDLVDEVWAPTRFTAASIAAATRKPVRVVPHAVPGTPTETAHARRALGLPDDGFIVLATLDSNSYPARKNPLGTIRAFRDAFAPGCTDARLIIKMHGRGHRDGLIEETLRQAAADPRIAIIDKVYTPEQMALLQNACDVALSLHRSEGFGFNIAEAMAVGKLAIATDFSGNVDFMNEDNSLPIPYRMRALARGQYCYGEGQWWAEPDHDAAVAALRLAITRSTRVSALAQRAKAHMARYHSFERIGRLSIATLNGTIPEPLP
ncbi:MAG: glycosyltransferase [Hyphomicrobiales bacterium]|nr:glycosyltransferase [Hyphomicrobiales bacterium]